MNVLILGDGPDEQCWAGWIEEQEGHRLAAVYPGWPAAGFHDAAVVRDLEEALATPGIELVIIGGPHGFRGEALRRAAAEGMAIICLHPPGDDSEPYYQVTLSRAETGAIIIPDLPLRLHPGMTALREALHSNRLGAIRSVRHDAPASPDEPSLVRSTFARLVDPVRALLGEIASLNASGDPPGEAPSHELVVQLRDERDRRAEVRTNPDCEAPGRIVVTGTEGSITLEYDPASFQSARLIERRCASAGEHAIEMEPWDPHAAILEALLATRERGTSSPESAPHPSLHDGTRAMELAEAVARSLRRGRTIDLHYEQISEDSSFKSIMTSSGCMILLSTIFLIPVALAGPPLGFPWTIYLAYAIPPVLVLFAVLQILRLGIRKDRLPRVPRPIDSPGGELR